MSRWVSVCAAVAMIATGLAACAPQPDSTPVSVTSSASTVSTEVVPATSSATPAPVADPRDTRAQAASLLMVGVTGYDDALWALQQGVGGIFIGSSTDPALLTDPVRNIATLRAEVGRPFIVSTDAEGGRVLRPVGLVDPLPSARELATTRSPQEVQNMAYDLGTRLRSLGITMDFAPVVDVDGGPAEAAIGDRAFSPDPQQVADYGHAFAQGLVDAGITPVFKHFPGHGRVQGDSHTGDVYSPDVADMGAVDLVPFAQSVAAFPNSGVLVGHMKVPGLTEQPASVSPQIYSMLRRGDYPGGSPFNGIIVTDDVSGMKAISAHYSTPDAVVASLLAGADMALWTSTADLVPAIDAVVGAVDSGAFPPDWFAASVRRVKEAADV